MAINIIAAVGKNLELGKNGNLIWHIPEDLKYFKENTMGKTIVMGRNTFNSLPKLLPGRKHIILSKTGDFNKDIGDSLIFTSKEELIDYINTELKNEDVFVIGGASIYSMFIDICDKMYLTRIGAEDKDADAYFPKFSAKDWSRGLEYMYTCNDIVVKHMIYRRKDR